MRQSRRFEVLELRRNDLSRREIAARLNVSGGLVSRYLKPMGDSRTEFASRLEQVLNSAPDDLDVSDIRASILRVRKNKPVQRFKYYYPLVIRLIQEECCETNQDFQDELLLNRKQVWLILEEMVKFNILTKPAPAKYQLSNDFIQRQNIQS